MRLMDDQRMTDSTAADMDHPDEDRMNCLEVWGGNCPRNSYLRRPGLDVWVWSEPQSCAESGGGDLHLLSSCASGRITRMLLADVCGFGSLFSEISDELRDLIKRNVNTIQQASAVKDLSCRLDDASQRGGFASTLISTYFAPARSFALCNTGHPPPFLYRASADQWSILKETLGSGSNCDSSLGVVHPNAYQKFETKLGMGDMVLSYSNALTESRGADGSTLGVNGLLQRVRQLNGTRPSDIGPSLLSRIGDEHPENLRSDDATILLCKATSTPVAWRDNVLAPFRLLRAVSDRTSIV